MSRFTETLAAHRYTRSWRGGDGYPHEACTAKGCSWTAPARSPTDGHAAHAAHVESVLAGAGVVAVDVQLIDELTDPDPCQWDHNHSCQAHGYFYLEQGVLCPQEEAKRVLAGVAAAVCPVTPEEPT